MPLAWAFTFIVFVLNDRSYRWFGVAKERRERHWMAREVDRVVHVGVRQEALCPRIGLGDC